jgi:hypothetical protein
MVTLAGTAAAEESDDKETAKPLLGAFLERKIVPVAGAPPTTELGDIETEETDWAAPNVARPAARRETAAARSRLNRGSSVSGILRVLASIVAPHFQRGYPVRDRRWM